MAIGGHLDITIVHKFPFDAVPCREDVSIVDDRAAAERLSSVCLDEGNQPREFKFFRVVSPNNFVIIGFSPAILNIDRIKYLLLKPTFISC